MVLGRRVHAMMAEIRYMADDIDAVLGGASGHVVVGTLIAASAKLLPEAIARLMTEHPGIQVTGLGQDAHWRGARAERLLAGGLDRRTIHHRVGERDADLTRVGARVRRRAHHVGPRAQTTGHVGHEQLAPGIARAAQRGLECSRAGRAHPRMSII